MAISDTTPQSLVPLSSLELTSKLTWIVTGSEVKKSGVTIKENYCPSLERVEVSTNASVFVTHQTSLIANSQTCLKQIQSNFNGSNTYGTMKNSSRQG